MPTKRSLNAAPDLAKRIKCEPLDIEPLECIICFESIRGRGETVNAKECGQCRVVMHGDCVAEAKWSTVCPQCASATVRPWKRNEGPGVDDEVIEILDDEEEEPLFGTNHKGWHFCAQRDCGYKTKNKGHLKRHGAGVHDIGVAWHYCEHPGCDYRAKHKGDLKRHCARILVMGKK